MATFWEKTASSVNYMFSLCYVYLYFVVSYFGFEGGSMVLIAAVHGHCLPHTF